MGIVDYGFDVTDCVTTLRVVGKKQTFLLGVNPALTQ